jgi:hypothetical protein
MDNIEENFVKSSTDIVKNPYYKRLQEELKQKHLLEQEKNVESSAIFNQTDVTNSENESFNEKNKDSNPSLFQDHVELASLKWQDNTENTRNLNPNSGSKHQKEMMKEFLSNGKEILRHLSHKINFKHRIPELKELYKHSLIESRSYNTFMSLFSQFKAGVVGQILSWLGIPIEQLKTLRLEAFKEAFDQNCVQMAHLIYNMELIELVKGKRIGKKASHLYQLQVDQLIKSMEALGRQGYWSKSKLLEERIAQCQRIEDEFSQELQNLEYTYHYYVQSNLERK